MPDVFIGVTKHPIKVNDTESILEVILNNSDNPLTLVACEKVMIDIKYIQKEVQLQSSPDLSESEYELLRLNNVSQLLEELDNQELDRFDMDDEESQHIP